MRAAIYARYSSDRQSERSIEDQVRLCREHADRLGLQVVSVHTDYAISGAIVDRPGLQTLLAEAKEGLFDTVVAEALDRISRDQEDMAGIFKRLTYAGVRIVTTSEGEINELHVGFKGTMNALFLKDLADKIRRGQRGRIAEGRIPGGLAYGYEIVREFGPDGEPVRGVRRIKDEEAAVIRRIFEMYAAGMAARAIAAELNREGIPAPRGGSWSACTINGNRRRRDGILWNELYIGRLIYNRQRFVKNPETRRRIPKPNPPDQWVVVEVPELRIVDQDLWDRVHAIKAKHENLSLPRRRRPKRLLSGLLRCGVCGGSYTIRSADRYGCTNRREKGTCSNSKTISARKLEDRVLSGLRDRLLSPKLLAKFAREYQQEWIRRKSEFQKQRRHNERRVAEIDRQLARHVRAIENGVGDPKALVARMLELEECRDRLREEIEAADADVPALDFHPHLAGLYRRKVAMLRDALNSDPLTRAEAVEILRSLIDGIVLHPGQKRGEMTIELRGQLATILTFAQKKRGKSEDLTKWVVAEEGLEPPTRGL